MKLFTLPQSFTMLFRLKFFDENVSKDNFVQFFMQSSGFKCTSSIKYHFP